LKSYEVSYARHQEESIKASSEQNVRKENDNSVAMENFKGGVIDNVKLDETNSDNMSNSAISVDKIASEEDTVTGVDVTTIENAIEVVLDENRKKRKSRWGADPSKAINDNDHASTDRGISTNGDSVINENQQKVDDSVVVDTAPIIAATQADTDAVLVDNISSDSVLSSKVDDDEPMKKKVKEDKASHTVVETVRSDRLRLLCSDSCNIIGPEGELIRVIPIEPVLPEPPSIIATTGKRTFHTYLFCG
jgi:hypothetical protein